ncbi:hypothetical protein K6V90_25780 [Cupriavidus pauculus]|uniref:hypothetical protein n=1 Tax=Cupriavidus pauculus TaxID=82633 RepID=UPI001C931A56|nr:hypothetical protein [Cupriavidus pauculus]MBY4733954.1 hypothetical protein [Cupriavidus pauculus]
MAKTKISVENFVDEVNRRLPAQYGYRPEWRFFLVPEGAGAAEAIGYSWEPRTIELTAAMSAIGKQMEDEFEVVLPFRIAAE